MISLKLKPLYSETFEGKLPDPLKDKLPSNWKLRTHQIETFNQFFNNRISVIFNSAITGDGKSFAALLPLISKPIDLTTIIMYPTNELIIDQFSKLIKNKYPGLDTIPKDIVHSEAITRLSTEIEFSERSLAIQSLLRKQLLLTNPDLFHLLSSLQYGWKIHLKDKLSHLIAVNFDYYVFDEFHTYSTDQIVSILNDLLFLTSRTSEPKKFIFLSATPKDFLLSVISRLGDEIIEIKGNYSDEPKEGWHQILQSIDLSIDQLTETIKAEHWIRKNLKLIKHFFSEYPNSKGAIIVDSVASAKRLKEFLKSEIKELRAIENTGFTSREERSLLALEDFDIVIATSTVDIGVDFHINFLVFEAKIAGHFIQRLGRIGRHPGFPCYKAFALVPRQVYEKLKEKLEGEISREVLNSVVHEAYKEEQNFASYIKKWGLLEAAHIYVQLEKMGSSMQTLRNIYANRIIKSYSSEKSFDYWRTKYWGYSNDSDKKYILDQLISFRGESPLRCAIWDTTQDDFLFYDLFYILANTNFEIIEPKEWRYAFKKKYPSFDKLLFQPFLYVKVLDHLEEYLDFSLGIDEDLLEKNCYLDSIQVLKHFEIRKHKYANQINKKLYGMKLVTLITLEKPKVLKFYLRLPPTFPVFKLFDKNDNEYSVVFGKEAILLDSLSFKLKKKENEKALIV